MLIAFIAFACGVGVASIVAVWAWPEKQASQPVADVVRVWYHCATLPKTDSNPRRRSSCSAPSRRSPQRNSRGRFCSRRRGGARGNQ